MHIYFNYGLDFHNTHIFYRYVDAEILKSNLIGARRGVIYFMDDDLLDIRALFSLPFPYAFRLWCKVTSKRKYIQSLSSKLLVSTIYLANKYSSYNPILIRPIASGELLIRSWHQKSYIYSRSNSVRICYHGTWSHRDDMKWLAPPIAEIQRRCANTIFEVIGGSRVAEIFKGIPRMTVLPTMAWSDYLKHTQTFRQDIGLAPLRDTLFNRGRGPIKFFDYARAGAVGVYSAGPAYSDFVSHGVDGFVLENDPSLWIERIVELVNTPQLRQSMAEAAWLKVLDNSPNSPDIQKYLQELNKAIEQFA